MAGGMQRAGGRGVDDDDIEPLSPPRGPGGSTSAAAALPGRQPKDPSPKGKRYMFGAQEIASDDHDRHTFARNVPDPVHEKRIAYASVGKDVPAFEESEPSPFSHIDEQEDDDPASQAGPHAAPGFSASVNNHSTITSSDDAGGRTASFIDATATPITAEVVDDEVDIESRVDERVQRESEEIARRIRDELAQGGGAAIVSSTQYKKVDTDEDDDSRCGCNKWVVIGMATAVLLIGAAAIAAVVVITSNSSEPSPGTPAPTFSSSGSSTESPSVPPPTSSPSQVCTLCADGTVPDGLEENLLTEGADSESITCAEFALSFESIDATDDVCAANQAIAWVSCGCPTLPQPQENPLCTLCEGGAAFLGANAASCEDIQTYTGLVSTLFPLLSCDSYKEAAAGCVCPEGVLGESEEDRRIEAFTEALTSVSGDLLQDPSTNQNRALYWLATEDEMVLPTDTPFETLSQRYIAALIFYETGGDENGGSWTLQLNFLSGENECDWNDGAIGLGCNDQDEITVIQIDSNGLIGQIPEEVSFLRELTAIKLDGNSIGGALPASIGSLSKLGRLELDDNSISSTIPDDLFTIPTLERVWIDNNTLSGGLPSTLGDATALTSLSLFTNRLQGPIPDIRGLTSLDYFGMGANLLTGPLPSFETIPGIRFIWLYQNNFNNQTIPPSIGQLTRLSSLALYGCGLSGPIPSFSNNTGYLELLYLFNNSLTGDVSTIIEDLASIEYGEDENTVGLTELEINRNDLFGTIPTSLAQLTAVEEIWMGTNPRVNGTVPSEMGMLAGTVRHLNLGETNITGTIPTEIGLLTSLTELGFYNADLSGPIPSELGQLGMVMFLDLQQQRLTGTVPDSLAGLSSIVGLGVADNQLDGTVPESLNHPELETFFLQRNEFVSLPPAFCDRSDPIDAFIADCGGGTPEVTCSCCSECCVDGTTNCTQNR